MPPLDEPPPFRWLVPGVLAGGPHPERQDRLRLAELHGHFDSVLSVYEEPIARQILEPWAPTYLWLRTLDGDPPDLVKACTFIEGAQQRGIATFVHCWAGIGRTGSVLAAWLLHTGVTATAIDARDRVRRDYHPGAIESTEQLARLESFARAVAKRRR